VEKLIDELDIKGLEDEIDSAVERLFVDKKGPPPESPSPKASQSLNLHEEAPQGFEVSEPIESISHVIPAPEPIRERVKEPEKDVFRAPPELPRPSPKLSPEPPSSLGLFEKLETQLLSLEWEITKETLQKTKEEVIALGGYSKERPDVTRVLNLMERVLSRMIGSEETIDPPLMKFLLDAKETIRLLSRKEADKEMNLYKQLIYGGIQARFFTLEGVREKKASLSIPWRESGEVLSRREEEVEKTLHRMNQLCERVEEALRKLEQPPRRSDQEAKGISPMSLKEEAVPPLNITVCRINESLFGVESDKVFKLFKVPESFQGKYSKEERVRLKDLDLRLIDLKKILSIQTGNRRGEMKILAVKGSGEFKGLMVDQVLRRFPALTDLRPSPGEYFLGVVPWTYQERPVEIPVLNVKKI
jgi:hypothetical protein